MPPATLCVALLPSDLVRVSQAPLMSPSAGMLSAYLTAVDNEQHKFHAGPHQGMGKWLQIRNPGPHNNIVLLRIGAYLWSLHPRVRLLFHAMLVMASWLDGSTILSLDWLSIQKESYIPLSLFICSQQRHAFVFMQSRRVISFIYLPPKYTASTKIANVYREDRVNTGE